MSNALIWTDKIIFTVAV